MNQAMQHRVFVDGNNVMGSRADGWWRDRGGAARRIAAEIALLARSRGGVWTIVFDGPGPRDTAPSRGLCQTNANQVEIVIFGPPMNRRILVIFHNY